MHTFNAHIILWDDLCLNDLVAKSPSQASHRLFNFISFHEPQVGGLGVHEKAEPLSPEHVICCSFAQPSTCTLLICNTGKIKVFMLIFSKCLLYNNPGRDSYLALGLFHLLLTPLCCAI